MFAPCIYKMDPHIQDEVCDPLGCPADPNKDEFVDISPLKQQIPVAYDKISYNDDELTTILEKDGVSVYQVQPKDGTNTAVLMEVGRFLQPIEVLITEFDFKDKYNCNMVLITYTVEKLLHTVSRVPIIKIIVSDKRGETTDSGVDKLFPIGCIMLNFECDLHKDNIAEYLSTVSGLQKDLHGSYSITFHYKDSVGVTKYVNIETIDTYLGQHEMFEKVIGCLHHEFIVDMLKEIRERIL